MGTVDRPRRAPRGGWPLLLAAGLVMTGCGGKSSGSESSVSGGMPPAAGGNVGAGGVPPGIGGLSGAGGSGGSTGGAGGDASASGSGGLGDGCEVPGLLWDAVSRAEGVIGYCYPPGPCRRGEMSGLIVVDGDGQIIDVMAFRGVSAKDEVLEALDGWRFPCLAGQTIEYCCFSE